MQLWRAFRAFFLLYGLGLGMALAASSQQALVDAPQLAALVDVPQVRIIDIRAPEDYAKAHVPGAISAPYGRWRGPANNPGELLSTAALQQLLQELGVQANEHIVVYSTGDSQTDFGAAARVYWTLKYAGLQHLSVLDGGFQQWLATQQSTSTDSPQIVGSDYVVQANTDLVVFKEELIEQVNAPTATSQLLDARPRAFYQGQVKAPTASTPGTIATARNAEHQQWFKTDSATLKSTEQIQQLVREQGLDQATATISFCNTGHWAATNWFVLSEIAGLPQVRLYPASLAEWTQNEQALPMEHTPSRWQQIQTQFKQLLKKD